MHVNRFIQSSLLFGDATPIVEALAWPVSVVIITMMLRAEIGRVMERLVRLKFQDFEAQFRHELRQSEELAEQTEPRRLLDLPSESRRIIHELNTPASRVPRLGPRAQIAEAWSDVAAAADRAAGTAGVDPLPALLDRSVLLGATLLLYERLRRLHAQLARVPQWEPTPSLAGRFVRLASSVAAKLAAAAPRADENRA